MHASIDTPGRTRWSVLIAWVLLSAMPIGAAAAPDQGQAEATPPQSAEAIQAPATIFQTAPLDQLQAPLELQHLTPVTPEDRGSAFTDAGLGTIASPNAIERAKLAMAREAIEASRAAGTLMVFGPSPMLPPAPADIDALKLEQLRQHVQPSAPAQAGADGIGGGLSPIQQTGPEAPTEAELAKLRQDWPATPNTAIPLEAKPAEAPAAPAEAESQEVR